MERTDKTTPSSCRKQSGMLVMWQLLSSPRSRTCRSHARLHLQFNHVWEILLARERRKKRSSSLDHWEGRAGCSNEIEFRGKLKWIETDTFLYWATIINQKLALAIGSLHDLICMENHASVTGWQKLFFSYKCFSLLAAVAIATFEIYGWKFSGYLILICSFSLC